MQIDYYKQSGPGRKPRMAAFDFETDGLGGEVLFATWITEDMEVAECIDAGDIVQELFFVMCERHEYEWFAHNAQYDWRYFIDRMIEMKDDIEIYSRADNQIFMVSIDLSDAYSPKAKLIMRDSYALFSQSLEKFTKQFSPDKSKLRIDFEKEKFNPQNEQHREYAKRDVESLLLGMTKFNQLLADTFSVNIRATISSTAMAAWCRTIDNDTRYYNHRESEDFVRSAYYGGYVYISSVETHENCLTYDINSSYAYQLWSHQYPYGIPTETEFFRQDVLGIYKVIVRCPDDIRAPILAGRIKNSLAWRTGMFETTCTSEELKFALANGYRLLKVVKGLIWPQTIAPFRVFIEKCMSIRKLYSGQPLETVAKLMQNSLYGKFGSKRERRKFYGTLVGEETLDAEMWGDFWVKQETADTMQCLPLWAVFTTAYARLHLLREIYRFGAENVLYCDTDSLTLKSGLYMIESTEYGGWKIAKKWDSFRARAPKVYAGRVEGQIDGAAKGMPKRVWKTQNVLEMIEENRPRQETMVKYRQLKSFVNVMKEPEYVGEVAATRHLSSLQGSPSWRVAEDGSVYPKSWQDDDF